MFGFRLIAVWIILVLLLGVIVENVVERKEKPLVFIAHDNSESILLAADSTFYKSEYPEGLRNLSQAISEEFEVISYSFSDGITDGIQSDYSGKTTDISKVLNQIFDQYSNRNIGAIVLSTDGIYNTGVNPVYAVSQKSFVPVFSVGLGDTNQVRDIKIEAVLHNEVAFLGNQFPVEVSFSQTKCKGEKVQVDILDGDKKIASKNFEFTDDFQQGKHVFNLTASGIGYKKYTASITVLADEFNKKNNSASFYVEVIDGRQKILMTYKAPHPDIGAIRYVIENNKNYEVDIKPFSETGSLKGYDLVIVHSYDGSVKELAELTEQGSVPVLHILGLGTNLSDLQQRKVGVSGNTGSYEELGFSYNPAFKEIIFSPGVIQTFSSAPPLHGPFGNIAFSSSVDALCYRKVGSIQLDQPLIYFSRKGGNRYGVITGEGIWRWRLYDQMKNSSTTNFEEFITKIITYLAIKENKDPFRIHINNEYAENDQIEVGAELYNQSFELVNEPEVSFRLVNEEEKVFEFGFVRTSDAYTLDLGRLKAGFYSWVASTEFQGKTYEKKGTFLVKEVRLEFQNSVADHRLLKNLAENSGGGFYRPDQLNDLEAELKNREDMVTVVYQEKKFDDLIDYWWIFGLIMLLFSIEWFIRKFQGAY